MRKYRTVLFDLDGTLLNTIEDLCDSVNHILQCYQCPVWTTEQLRPFLGNGIRRLMELSVPGGAENPRFEEMFRDFKAYYTAHCEEKTRPYPGVENLLSALQDQKVPMAVVSNKNYEAVEALGRRFFPSLTVCMGQREGLRRKPAPDMVEAALKAMGQGKEGAVYVGDSEVDFETAANAGLPCILVTWGFRSAEQIAALHPDAVANCPQDLLTALTEEV